MNEQTDKPLPAAPKRGETAARCLTLAENARTVCAWCNPGPAPAGTSHGICLTHKAEFLQSLKASLHGKVS